jgi:6-phosphogluconolactonase
MKNTLYCAAAFLAGCISPAAAAAANPVRVYFGTAPNQERSGIYMALFDNQTGRLGTAARVSQTAGGFIAIHPGRPFLYATGTNIKFDGINTGSVNAFRIDESSGTLTDINTQPSGGLGPCHLSIDPSGKNLLVANYAGGSCAVLPIQSDGSLAAISSVQTHSGFSINPKRQTKAFTHSINCDPSGNFAFAADLGIDKIMIYRLNAVSGTLISNEPPFVETEQGGGPRHFTFHPSGKFAYANLELLNKVSGVST